MDFLGQVAAVALVFALLGLAIWAFGKRRGLPWRAAGARGRSSRISVVERATLSPQHSLHLVRLGDRALLVACYPGGCALLDDLPWWEQAPGEEGSGR